MPKLRTKRTAKKRFHATKSGKFKRAKAFGKHLLTNKSSKRRRNLRKSTFLSPQDAKRVRRLLPYG